MKYIKHVCTWDLEGILALHALGYWFEPWRSNDATRPLLCTWDCHTGWLPNSEIEHPPVNTI